MMLGLIKLPNKTYPCIAGSLEAAVGSVLRIDRMKPRNPQEFCRAIPPTWGRFLDHLTDQHVQLRQARREPYLHAPIELIDRTSPAWLIARVRYELRARTILSKIRFAPLMGAITWNGLAGDAALAAQALRELGIPTLYAELSPFKGRYFLDHLGVNAGSSLQDVVPERLPAYEDEDRLFATLKENYRGRRTPTSALNDPSSLPSSFVFAPLQIPVDTQIIVHGGAIRRQSEYLDMLRNIAEQLPKGMTLVVKPHPGSHYRASYLQEMIGENIVLATDYETRDLLERCTAVITVNSTVGADGFLFDKPIIAVGNAPWVKPALAVQATTPTGVCEALAALPTFDKRLRKRFLAHWYHAYTWCAHDEPRTLRPFLEAKLEAAGVHKGEGHRHAQPSC